MFYLTRILFKN